MCRVCTAECSIWSLQTQTPLQSKGARLGDLGVAPGWLILLSLGTLVGGTTDVTFDLYQHHLPTPVRPFLYIRDAVHLFHSKSIAGLAEVRRVYICIYLNIYHMCVYINTNTPWLADGLGVYSPSVACESEPRSCTGCVFPYLMVNQDLLNMSDLGVMDVYGSASVDGSHTAGRYYKNDTLCKMTPITALSTVTQRHSGNSNWVFVGGNGQLLFYFFYQKQASVRLWNRVHV